MNIEIEVHEGKRGPVSAFKRSVFFGALVGGAATVGIVAFVGMFFALGAALAGATVGAAVGAVLGVFRAIAALFSR